MKHLLIFILSICCFSFIELQAQSISPYLVRSTISVSGSSKSISVKDKKYVVQQSIGQTSSIGTLRSSGYTIRQGFIQPNILAKILDKNLRVNLEAVVYPNPFTEYVSISFDQDISGDVSVYIYDLFGKVVMSKTYTERNEIRISLIEIPESLYILKILYQDNQFIRKIKKE